MKIPCLFEFIRSKSKESFKKLVKVRAKAYALEKLGSQQNKHSKMENLNYQELKIQKYLVSESTTSIQKKIVFKYRTRMENYGENFRGGASQVMCSLCKLHLDNQELVFQCQEIRSKIDVKGEMKDLYRVFFLVLSKVICLLENLKCIKF